MDLWTFLNQARNPDTTTLSIILFSISRARTDKGQTDHVSRMVLTQNDRQMNLGSILQVARSRTMLSIYTNSQENSVKCEKQFAPFPGHLSGATFHLLHAHSSHWEVTLLLSSKWNENMWHRPEEGGVHTPQPLTSTPFCNQCQSHCLTNPLSSSY